MRTKLRAMSSPKALEHDPCVRMTTAGHSRMLFAHSLNARAVDNHRLDLSFRIVLEAGTLRLLDDLQYNAMEEVDAELILANPVLSSLFTQLLASDSVRIADRATEAFLTLCQRTGTRLERSIAGACADCPGEITRYAPNLDSLDFLSKLETPRESNRSSCQ